MAAFSFLEEYDLSGKTIVPFCAHGTGGIAGSVRDITAVLPDSVEILEPIGVYRPDIDSAQPAVNDWLDSLGYTEPEGMSGTVQVEKAEKKETSERMDSAMENKIVTREYKDVVYDTLSEAQKFDLYLPKEGEGPFPLVFFIHGGGWFRKAASPIQYITEDIPPVLLQHGNADTICPISQSERLYRAITETAGEEKAEFDILEGAEHGDSDFETAENMERIVEFLRRWGL